MALPILRRLLDRFSDPRGERILAVAGVRSAAVFLGRLRSSSGLDLGCARDLETDADRQDRAGSHRTTSDDGAYDARRIYEEFCQQAS